MMKSHPLSKLQLLLAIISMIPSCLLIYVSESTQNVLFLVSMIPFIGLSVITIYLGWLITIRKEIIIFPYESFTIWLAKNTRGQKAVIKLTSNYTNPNGKYWIGVGSLFLGAFCLVIAFVGIVIIVRDFL